MSSKTLEQYLAAAIDRGQINHALCAHRGLDGKITFYVRPLNGDGETLDFVVRGNGLALNLTSDSDVHQGIEGLMETRIPILEQIRELCWAIEKCGASPELTVAVTKASALSKPITHLVEQAIALGLDTGGMSVSTSCDVKAADPEPIETSIGGIPGEPNPVHLAVDLGHAIAKLAQSLSGLEKHERIAVDDLIKAMAGKATELLGGPISETSHA